MGIGPRTAPAEGVVVTLKRLMVQMVAMGEGVLGFRLGVLNREDCV